MDYHDLPKEKRWLRDGDSPYSIGGRSTDIENIGFALEDRLRGLYPINEVPPALAVEAKALTRTLKNAELAIEHLILSISITENYRP